MRRLLTGLLVAAAATACISCDAPHADAPSAPSVAYEPRGSIDRAPLAPPAGSASATISDSSSPAGPGDGFNSASTPTNPEHLMWRSSPRWAAIKGNDKLEGDPTGDASR
jgi:hypothetical protein